MSLLNLIFGKKLEIENEIVDDKLGSLKWSNDDDSWVGIFNGLKFDLSYEKNTTSPSNELRSYAYSILSHREFLEETLSIEKNKWIDEYPDHKEDIEALQFDYVSFYRYKGKHNRIFAHLTPENDVGLWRIEYSDRKCEGMGFDS